MKPFSLNYLLEIKLMQINPLLTNKKNPVGGGLVPFICI